MKPSDFIVESIGADADAMHKDHEVQLARQDCYNAAKNAIELHKLLASVSEQEGLEGWISEKLTLAADYLNTVKEHFEYQQRTATHFMLPEFTFESADAHMNSVLADMCQVCGQTPCNCTHVNEGTDPWTWRKSTVHTNTEPELRGVNIPGTMKHPQWNKPAWSFQEIAQKLGISTGELKALRLHYDGFPTKIAGVGSKTPSHGTVANYYNQQEVKRWVKSNNIQDLIKSKKGVADVHPTNEEDEFAPSKRAATGVATHNWRRGGERTGSLKGYVVTTFDHIKSVFGDPISGPTDKPYDKVSCEWVITFKDGTTATIYDYKTGKTPMNEYRWHIGGTGKAVEYVTHLLGLEAEDMYEGKQTVSEMTAGGTGAGGFATGPTGGGAFKKTTGVPKKVKNTLRRVSPKIGTGIYK